MTQPTGASGGGDAGLECVLLGLDAKSGVLQAVAMQSVRALAILDAAADLSAAEEACRSVMNMLPFVQQSAALKSI